MMWHDGNARARPDGASELVEPKPRMDAQPSGCRPPGSVGELADPLVADTKHCCDIGVGQILCPKASNYLAAEPGGLRLLFLDRTRRPLESIDLGGQVLVERTVVRMSADGFGAFAKAIAGPGHAVKALVKVLQRRAPWE